MSHWRHTMVDGAEIWISCQRLRLLRKSSHWQLIQKSAPSTIMWRQCDIWTKWQSISLEPRFYLYFFCQIRKSIYLYSLVSFNFCLSSTKLVGRILFILCPMMLTLKGKYICKWNTIRQKNNLTCYVHCVTVSNYERRHFHFEETQLNL